MNALRSFFYRQEKERKWQTYAAEMLYVSAKSNYKEFPFPSYVEFIKENPKQESRTAEELRRDLLARLRRE